MIEQEPGAVEFRVLQMHLGPSPISEALRVSYRQLREWCAAHDAEDARREARLIEFRNELSDHNTCVAGFQAAAAEREALLARLVEVGDKLMAEHDGDFGPEFGTLEMLRAALAAARAADGEPWGCTECRMGFHQHTETCSRAVAP